MEALVEKKGTKDARDFKRSNKRHSRREGSKEVDLENPKKQRVTSSHQEKPKKEDLQMWYARQEGGGRNDTVYIPMSLFVPKIVNLKIPRNYQNLKFTVYNDKSDPFVHVWQYRNTMSFWNREDKLLCNIFLESLGELSSEWFEKLPLGSVSTFNQVAGLFTQRFKTNQK